MYSQSKNRVQAIKSKFENLTSDTDPLLARKKIEKNHLCKQASYNDSVGYCDKNVCTDITQVINKENVSKNENTQKENEEKNETKNMNLEKLLSPNTSYLHSNPVSKSMINDSKVLLSRQSSDPGKKLQRSHAFRCDKSTKMAISPKRFGSCKGRPETSNFGVKPESNKSSDDRLVSLSNSLDNNVARNTTLAVKSENMIENESQINSESILQLPSSIPDSDVPKHILDQYAKVLKPRKSLNSYLNHKKDLQIDSGVSSETENIDEEKCVQKAYKKLEEPVEPNILVNRQIDSIAKEASDEQSIGGSTETLKLERKNPHLTLTDTLKKALKQPLPVGPPPKKPPRTFGSPILESPEKIKKKDAKKMLEKLEMVLQKREANSSKNIYDIAETDLSQPSTLEKPKEVHYLCTEILDITQRTLLPNQTNNDLLINCFNSLNCAVATSKSTVSLPYSRLSTGSIPNPNWSNSLNICCSCSSESLDLDRKPRLSTFLPDNKCVRCKNNENKNTFKCHLNCKCCSEKKSNFFVDRDKHIYDVPFGGITDKMAESSDVNLKSILRKSDSYGVINYSSFNRIMSKSIEDIKGPEEEKIYDIPCDLSRPTTPDPEPTTTTEFQKLRSNFENRSVTFPKSAISRPRSEAKPPTKPKPQFAKRTSDSKIQTVTAPTALKMASSEDFEMKLATDLKRPLDNDNTALAKRDKKDQLDLDKENLNRLMNEIYDTVSEACKMDDQRPNRFPTDSTSTSSEESVKLTRSLTEKRKNYVRRVSSRAAYLDSKTAKKRYRNQTSVCSYNSEVLDNPYSTFRSWKSFKNSQNNLNATKSDVVDRSLETSIISNSPSINQSISPNVSQMDQSFDALDNSKSIDDRTGCLELKLPFVPRRNGLMDVCLLVGLNYMTGQAYVKNVYPDQVKLPPHIENLVFPETLSVDSTEGSKPAHYELSADKTHYYSFVLTDEKGHRNYGYCRRVLPEGASSCLPLCYCIISRYRSPGFYYKVLKEIESHHGSSEVQINTILNQLFNSDFPNPGEEIILKYETKIHQEFTKNYLRKSVNLGEILKSKTLPSRRSEWLKKDPSLPNGRGPKTTDVSPKKIDSPTEKTDSIPKSVETKLNFNKRNSFKDVLDDLNEKLKFETSKYDDASFSVRLDSDTDVPIEDTDADVNTTDSNVKIRDDSYKTDYTKLIPEFYDLENNNRPKSIILSLESEKTHVIKRPIEPRVDELSMVVMMDTFGAGLLIKVFGSLLLERKVVIVSDSLSRLSACIEGLQSILYPFVWQQPLISTIPSELRREILEAPLPILAGMLKMDTDLLLDDTLMFEEGMLIDISTPTPKTIFYQGDESTILPTSSYKTLKTTLAMETTKNHTITTKNQTITTNDTANSAETTNDDALMRNVMISEAFLRFFVDVLNGFSEYFEFGVVQDGGFGKEDVVFHKDTFIKSKSSKQNQYFLEWFTESAMFNHFIQNMAVCFKARENCGSQDIEYSKIDGIVDAPLPNFYEIFEDRLSGHKKDSQKSVENNSKVTYKMAMNKKVKMLKNKLRDLVT